MRSPIDKRARHASWLFAMLLMWSGCGAATAPNAASEPAPVMKVTPGTPQPAVRSRDRVTMSAEVGALDKRAVAARAREALNAIDACLEEGRRRIKTLGGLIEVKLAVSASGKAQGYFSKSTIGDHITDTCILAAFTARSWPKPVGGKTGHIVQGYEFSPPDAPREWSPESLKKAMEADEDGAGSYEAFEKQLRACRDQAGPGRFDVFMYLDEDGMALGTGVASGDERAPKAFSCVETVINTTSFPSPGQGSTKVMVPVR